VFGYVRATNSVDYSNTAGYILTAFSHPLKLFGRGDAVGSGLLFILLIGLYFVPWLISLSRKHNNSGAIAILNIFLGWTVIGWIVALIWSMTDNVRKQDDEYAPDGTDERDSLWD